MINDRTSRILSRFETGLRTDSVRLKQLDRDFGVTLASARDLGLEQAFSEEWNATWNQRWVIVEELLLQISGLVSEMDIAIESAGIGRLDEALNAWESIQPKDAHLIETMSAIRIQASAMNPAARIEWNRITKAFDANLESIHACSQALRVKLELLTEYPKEEVDVLVLGFLAKLPKYPKTDPLNEEEYQRKLDAAAVELEKEQHQYGGFLDVVKSLFMWAENPAERVRNNRSLRID